MWSLGFNFFMKVKSGLKVIVRVRVSGVFRYVRRCMCESYVGTVMRGCMGGLVFLEANIGG